MGVRGRGDPSRARTEVEVFIDLPPPGAAAGEAFQPPANARRSSLENYVEGDALTGTPASLAAAIARAYGDEAERAEADLRPLRRTEKAAARQLLLQEAVAHADARGRHHT